MSYNQYKKISQTAQPFTIPYSDESGYITAWLQNDPIIKQLQTQNEFIGSIATCPEGEEQSVLTQFVVDTKGVPPEQGNLVNITDRGDQWMYTGTQWVFYTDYLLMDATRTRKGIVSIGDGLNVDSGKISVDPTIYSPSKSIITNSTSTSATISNVAANTDYMFTQPLTSLTLTAVEVSQYPTDIYFETGSNFTFSAPTVTEWYFSDNPPTFRPNTSYKIHISQGQGTIFYVGERIYPLNKIVVSNPQLSPSNGIATWSFTNTLGTSDVIVRLVEMSSGDTVTADVNSSTSTIIIRFNADAVVSASTYKAIILG